MVPATRRVRDPASTRATSSARRAPSARIPLVEDAGVAQRRRRRSGHQRGEGPLRPDRVEGGRAGQGGVQGGVHATGHEGADRLAQPCRTRDEELGPEPADERFVADPGDGDHADAARDGRLGREAADGVGRPGHQQRLPGAQAEAVERPPGRLSLRHRS